MNSSAIETDTDLSIDLRSALQHSNDVASVWIKSGSNLYSNPRNQCISSPCDKQYSIKQIYCLPIINNLKLRTSAQLMTNITVSHFTGYQSREGDYNYFGPVVS